MTDITSENMKLDGGVGSSQSIADTTSVPHPDIQRVGLFAPFSWLKLGFDDLIKSKFQGSLYGAVFALMGLTISTIYATRWQLTMGTTASFFLMGPFICCGLYAISRSLEKTNDSNLFRSMLSFTTNPKSIAFFAAMLTFLMIVWARVSVIIFALFSNRDFPTLQGVIHQIFSLGNIDFLIVWMCAGLIFASIVFAISVVSVPMMIDRGTDTMMAVFTSARALITNPGPLYLWALLIVTIIGSSLLLGFYPLIITAPLIGHATWHAYRALVKED